MTLLICRTCPRYDTADNGEFRRALDEWDIPAELADHVSSITYKRGPVAPSPAPSHNPQPSSYVWRRGAA